MMITRHIPPQHVLHADDDMDDCYLFDIALKQLDALHTVTTVHNGIELMQLLTRVNYVLPDVLFLDLNMPLKNGFECMLEISNHTRLKDMTVIIFSTSCPPNKVQELYAMGAQYFLRKPDEFTQFKSKISFVLSMINEQKTLQPAFEEFLL